ncbi:MAG: hypothetical protein J1F11_05575 [Oscillospiraceae bacterium]|nr:hypothetical protein [Oscillospiraceae bacterium]
MKQSIHFDYNDYNMDENQIATLKLLSELAKSEKSAKEEGWLSEEEADAIIKDL